MSSMKGTPKDTFDAVKSRYQRKYKLLSPYLPELIAMKEGLRTAIQLTLTSKEDLARNRPPLEAFCARVGFSLSTSEIFGEYKIVISRSEIGELDRLDMVRMGELFAYPRCCIERYREVGDPTIAAGAAMQGSPERSACKPGASRTSKPRPPPASSLVPHPLTNYIRELLGTSERYPFEMNLFLRTSPFNLYLHLPCSMECQETLRYTRKLLEVIGTENPELHAYLIRFNRAPAWFTDICAVGILFEGKVSNHEIEYTSFYYDHDPSSDLHLSRYNKPKDCELFESIVAALSRGNRLKLQDRRLLIQQGQATVGAFEKPEHLRWRLIDFT